MLGRGVPRGGGGIALRLIADDDGSESKFAIFTKTLPEQSMGFSCCRGEMNSRDG